jgi:TolA-binding protein
MIRRVFSDRLKVILCLGAAGWGIGSGGMWMGIPAASAQELSRPSLQPFQPEAAPAASALPEVRRALPVTPETAPAAVEPPIARATPTEVPVSAVAPAPTPAIAPPVSSQPSARPAAMVPPRSNPRSAAPAVLPGTEARRNPAAAAVRPGATPASRYPAPGTDAPQDALAPAPTPELAQRRIPSSRPPSAAPPPTAPATGGVSGADPGSDAADTSNDIRIAPQAPGVPALPPEETQFNLANSFYLRKQYAQAAPEYERYLGLFPNGSRRQAALWWLGECYRNLDRTAAARSSYQNLVIAYTSGEFVGPANFRLATLTFAEKDFKTALPLFQRSAALATTDDVRLSSRYFEALCLENLDRRDETREVYEDILSVPAKNNPYRDEAHLSLARLAVAQKHPNDAFKQFEALSREAAKPELRAESTLKAGLLAKELGQNETALALLTNAPTLPGASAAMRADAQLALLHLLYDTNKYQRLLDAYPAAKRDLPDSAQAEALLLAANSQRQIGKHAEAQALYGQIVSQYPRSSQAPEARYQRIISLYASNSADFVKEADEFLLSSPASAKADQVRLMKADTLFKKADYAGAAQAYGTLDNASNLPAKYKAEAAYRLGYCCAQLRQPEKTIAAFTKFLRVYPEHPFRPKALVQRAVAFQQLKNYSSALADFNEVINDFRNAKERELALQQKALILGQQEDSVGMSDAFRMLLKDYPKTQAAGLAQFYIGRAAFDAKDYASALTAFEAARKADPKEYGGRASLSIIVCNYQLRNKAKVASEVEAYQKAGTQPVVPGEVMRWLGEQEFEEKDYDGAEKHLTAATATNNLPDTWLMLARARMSLEKWEPALDASRHYLELSAAEPVARAVGLIAQGDAQLGLKRYDEAQKSSDEALQLQPEGQLNAKARLLSGRVSFARGDYEQAGKSFMSVAVLYEDAEITPQALRRAAEAFEKAGRPEEAARAAEELKTRFPNSTAQTRQGSGL